MRSEELIIQLQNEVNLLKENYPIPQCCPVCGGNGLVTAGFYQNTGYGCTTSTAASETCRSCNGNGYLLISK